MTKKEKWLKKSILNDLIRLNKTKEVKYLFTDWGSGMANFKIYDSYESFNLITQRDIKQRWLYSMV